MTRDERTIVRMAVNEAKRAWLEAEGGYRAVEYDARCMDQRIAGRGRGTYDRTRVVKAEAMRARGMTWVQIGRELGVHHSTVIHWLSPERRETKAEQQRARRNACSHTRSQSTSVVR